ncbi:MAG: TIGR02996 domain-containing protein [Myxococcaceae bacterium]
MKTADALKSWKKSKGESLRALILALDEQQPEEALRGLEKLRIAQVVERLEGWNTKADDPRLVRALEQLLTDVPWSSDGSKPAWRQIFKLVEASGDPRYVALKPQFKVRPLMQEWLASAYAKAIAKLPASFPPEKDAAKWQKALDALPKKKVPAGAKDERALFEAVYANPADDGPRQVLADFLLEKGDPRGEFINLQLHGGDEKREKALLKQHGKTWLEPFGTALGANVEWKRGFPVKGVVKFKAQRDAEKLGALSEWATFEELEWAEPGASSAQQRPWTLHINRQFRHLKHAVRPHLPLMLEGTEPWAVETLVAQTVAPDELRAFAKSKLFPKLRTLEFRGLFSSSAFEGVTSLQQVKRLVISQSNALDRFVGALNGIAHLEELWFGDVLRLTRDAKGQFTKLEFHVAKGNLTNFNDARDLKPGWVTSVQFTGDGELKPAVEEMVRAKVRAAGGPDPLEARAAGVLERVPNRYALLAWVGPKHVAMAHSELIVADVDARKRVAHLKDGGCNGMWFRDGKLWVAEYQGLSAYEPLTGKQLEHIAVTTRGPAVFLWSLDGTRLTRGYTVTDVVKKEEVPAPRGWKELIRLPDDSAALKWVNGGYHLVRQGVKESVPLEGAESWFGMKLLADGSLLARTPEGIGRWDAVSGKRLAWLAIAKSNHQVEAKVSHDGTRVWTLADVRTVVIASLPSLTVLSSITLPGNATTAELSPDNSRLAVLIDGELKLVPV